MQLERMAPAAKGIHGFEILHIIHKAHASSALEVKRTLLKRVSVKSDFRVWHIKILKCHILIEHVCRGYY